MVIIGQIFGRTSRLDSKIAFQPDGTRLIPGVMGHSIVDLQKGRRLQRFVAHQGWVLDVAFSHDGSLFASAGRDGMVLIWSQRVWRLLVEFPLVNRYRKCLFHTLVSISIALPGLIEVSITDNQRRLRRITW